MPALGRLPKHEEDGVAAGPQGRPFMAQNLRANPFCRPIRPLPWADMDAHSKFQNLPRFGLNPEIHLISKRKNKTPEKSGVRQQSEAPGQPGAFFR